jgi:hypothetical protein
MQIPIINFPDHELPELGKKYFEQYSNNSPFPNLSFEDFFNKEFLDLVLEEFPDLSSRADYKFNNQNEAKLATKGEYKLGPNAKTFIRFLNSQPFLDFLSNLTGIENLLPDPTLAGGGYHEIKPGGFLKIHSDFNKHPVYRLDRRINVLIYLNKDWPEEYGGHFELWNEDMTECVKKISPKFNTLALFSTTSKSYHGHPNPLTCPASRSRKSIALYYYTNGRPQHEVEEFLEDHSTIFKARKGKDDKEATEDYLNRIIKKKKQEKRKENSIKIVKAITPPIIFSFLKNIFSR